VRFTLNVAAMCIGISLFCNVLNCKKVDVCKMLTVVSCSAVLCHAVLSGWMGRWTDRQTDRQIDRQIDR
jgi:hypothetical protein